MPNIYRIYRICIVAICALYHFPQQTLANPADLDPTFAGRGILTGFGGGQANCWSVAVQSDGKPVLAGSVYGLTNDEHMVILRFTTNGLPDFTFGHCGQVVPVVKFGSYAAKYSQFNSVKIQADGKIIAGGWSIDSTSSHFSLFRCLADGTPDPAFGTNGNGVMNLGGQYGNFAKIALQSDGKIVGVGNYSTTGYTGYALVRCLTNGLPDPSFGTGGYYLSQSFLGTNSAPVCVYLQSNGKINVAGSKSNPNHAGLDIALYQFNTNGTLDTSFNNGAGFVETTVSSSGDNDYTDLACDMAIMTSPSQPSVLVLTGEYSSPTHKPVVLLVSYNLDGTLNTNFGIGGIVTSDLNPSYRGFSALNLIIQGTLFRPRTITVFGGAASTGTNAYFLAARYNSAGVLDTNFAANGYAVIPVSLWNYDIPGGMALQGTNVILAGSSRFTTNVNNYAMSAVRVDGTGHLDYSFGDDGYLFADVGERKAVLNSLLVQPDGKILTGGYFNRAGFSVSNVLALARCRVDGTPDYLFGYEGKLTLPLSAGLRTMTMALQSDGKILATVTYSGGGNNSTVIRFRTNGTIDTSFGTNGFWGENSFSIYAIRVQPDGKIILGGSDDSQFYAARLNANGSLDATFGSSGFASIVLGGEEAPGKNGLLFQPDGKIILGGTVMDLTQNVYEFGVTRFYADGTIDIPFGTVGRTVASSSNLTYDFGNAVGLQSDGKILIGGYVLLSSTASYFCMARFTTNGVLDTTFGANGFAITSVPGQQQGMAMAVQLNDKILLAGVNSNPGTNNQAVICQYNADGSLDPTFGASGSTNVDFGSGLDQGIQAMSLDYSGRIVLGGVAGNTFGIARLLGLGEVPSLKIVKTDTNTIVVSWPRTPTWWQIEQSTDLVAEDWTFPAVLLQTNLTDNYIIIPSPNLTSARFYRLAPPTP